MKATKYILLSLVLLVVSTPMHAGWLDYLERFMKSTADSPYETVSVGLTDNEMIAGLKEALGAGTRYAVESLGQDGGFLQNAKVKIPVPASLTWVEKSLRTVRQDKLADEFIAAINHAAEQAVPEAARIFGTAIREMSVVDAKNILRGPDDAATQYFRAHTQEALMEKMRPIVSQATRNAGVTSAYKNMTARAGAFTSMLSSDVSDLDGYVTRKTLDGLFLVVAEEEKRIRENPLARSTELMKKVFGAYGR